MQKINRSVIGLTIVKKCHKHGDLTAKDVIKSGKHNHTRCRECYKAVRRNNYLTHKSGIAAKAKKWREANPERNKELNRKSRKKRELEGLADGVQEFPKRDKKFHMARMRLRNVLLAINKVIRDVDKIN